MKIFLYLKCHDLPALVALWANMRASARGAWLPEGLGFNFQSRRKNCHAA